MKDPERMATAARNAMVHVLDLTPSDKVLVVTDPETVACGEAWETAAQTISAGAEWSLRTIT